MKPGDNGRSPRRSSLEARRAALLARIHVARLETAESGRLVAADLQAMERTRRSILAGLQIVKAAVAAAGVIWSLNATSRIGRGSRLVSVAISLLSTLRAMRGIRPMFIPLAPLPVNQG